VFPFTLFEKKFEKPAFQSQVLSIKETCQGVIKTAFSPPQKKIKLYLHKKLLSLVLCKDLFLFCTDFAKEVENLPLN